MKKLNKTKVIVAGLFVLFLISTIAANLIWGGDDKPGAASNNPDSLPARESQVEGADPNVEGLIYSGGDSESGHSEDPEVRNTIIAGGSVNMNAAGFTSRDLGKYITPEMSIQRNVSASISEAPTQTPDSAADSTQNSRNPVTEAIFDPSNENKDMAVQFIPKATKPAEAYIDPDGQRHVEVNCADITPPPTEGPPLEHGEDIPKAQPTQPRMEPTQPTQPEPEGGDTNDQGQVWFPGFGWVTRGGETVVIPGYSDGDINKQVGEM
jgi:hypothetical protein